MFSDHKKGIIAVQFNWILVLIIGGLILTLFISIVQKQKAVSEEGIAGTIQTDLQAILSSSQVSTGTASIVDMPNKEISFGCVGGMPGFKLGMQNPANFPYAFAPDLIKSDRSTISVYAYDWSIPYKVTNFLYVTSPDIKYVLVRDANGANDDLLNALQGLLPPPYIQKDSLQKLFMNIIVLDYADPLEVTDTNNYKVRVIYFSTEDKTLTLSKNLRNTKNKDFSALAVIPYPSCQSLSSEQMLDCGGTLKFYNYNLSTDKWTGTQSAFLGKASLLAAIFSENKEIYDCGMNNAITRLNSTSAIYRARAQKLVTDSSSCSTQYSNAITDINQISNLDYQSITDLDSLNNQLIEASCPPIY
jgi:hypothetical protein